MNKLNKQPALTVIFLITAFFVLSQTIGFQNLIIVAAAVYLGIGLGGKNDGDKGTSKE